MKYRMSFWVLAMVFAIASCSNIKNNSDAVPKPGSVLESQEMPITEDSLNNSKFSVSIIADSQIEKGIYAVTAIWGNNKAESKFTMPKGGESLKPLLRKANKPNAFIIGFKAGKDTTFNEYFEVSGVKGTIKMFYTKSYSFD